ncbi:VOC family protein [Rhodococcus sp. BP-332]|uniref:VOC family protein n=1 Tax=Rhodococcus sp. BP-332 TaxID=2739447 RepID=UPI001C9A3EDA|nr:VOC family protein [Rhodococcus sp. BP-332]MBY6677903.1 VOC family protein [Rhodococcus sp. BP-332]
MTETQHTETTPTVVWPALRYDDARAAIAFLVDVLGFTEAAVYGEGERVDHAELVRAGGGAVMLGSARPDSTIAGLPPGVGAVYVAVGQDELTRLHDRAREAGARIVEPLRDEDYGGQGFTCLDPEGVHWSFGTYRGHSG